VLFLKRTFAWPRQSGHDVHCFGMMRALGELGHGVGVATFEPVEPEALAGATIEWQTVVGPASEGEGRWDLVYTAGQERFRSYWGAGKGRVLAVRDAARRFHADAVVAGGMDVLPYFPALREFTTVWYAADELTRQYLGWVRPGRPATWKHVRDAALMVPYERVFARATDRVWVVTDDEATAMRRYGGFRGIDVLPNGVDAEHFSPRDVPEAPNSCVFWGRLDFAPNIQAVEWFVERVWPGVRAAWPDARFTMIGFNPVPEVKALHGRDGLEVMADVPDLRDEVCRRAVVVLPFVSGGGIKNKLLEAAALGRPIVCSRRALDGLQDGSRAALLEAGSPAAWIEVLGELWRDPARRRTAGSRARAWVTASHTWEAVARRAADVLRASSAIRRQA
jgi:glycosyltransferase involved in cell wall biosynthesis